MPKLKAISVVRTLPTKLDLIGFAIFAPAAIQLLLALQYGGNQFAWNSSTVIGLFCGAGATSLVFLAWDYYKGDAAMIPLSMIRKRTVWSSCLVYGFLMSQLFCTSYYLPIYFQGVKGVSPTLSGAYLLPSILSQLFLAVGSGTLGKDIYSSRIVKVADDRTVEMSDASQYWVAGYLVYSHLIDHLSTLRQYNTKSPTSYFNRL